MPYSNYRYNNYTGYAAGTNCGWCGAYWCNCSAFHGDAPRGGVCVHGEPASVCDRGGCDEW